MDNSADRFICGPKKTQLTQIAKFALPKVTTSSKGAIEPDGKIVGFSSSSLVIKKIINILNSSQLFVMWQISVDTTITYVRKTS